MMEVKETRKVLECSIEFLRAYDQLRGGLIEDEIQKAVEEERKLWERRIRKLAILTGDHALPRKAVFIDLVVI